MTIVRYVGDEPREVSILPAGNLKLVKPDETFEVPEKYAGSYGCQPHYFEVPGYEPEHVDPNTPDPDLDPPADAPVDSTTTKKKAGN